MRFAAAVICWLLATVALAMAVPAVWAQRTIVDEDGYARFAEEAAHDPAIQSAMTDELTSRAMALIAKNGQYQVDSAAVHDVAAAFTAGPSFPPLFGQLNRAVHAWLFSRPRSEPWLVDVAPMLREPAIQQQLSTYGVKVPETLTVPVTVSGTQGNLHRAAVWGPWIGVGASAGCIVFALLTVLVARRRGRALTGLGVSALLVGAVGWGGIEVAGPFLNEKLNRTTGDIRRMADAMVGHAEASLHGWLNITLAGGAALVILGVLVAVVGGLFTRPRQTV